MKGIIFVVMVLLSAASFADMFEPKVVKVLSVKKGLSADESRVQVSIPDDIPLNYWVNCNYYSSDKGIVASTRHVLLERVPSWTVDAVTSDVNYVICFVPR